MILPLFLLLLMVFCASPARADQYFDYGVRLFQQRNYRDAVRYFESRLKLVPGDGNALYYKALCYQGMGNLDRAKELFDEVIASFPGTQPGKLAEASLKSIKDAEAAREAALAAAANPEGIASSSPQKATAADKAKAGKASAPAQKNKAGDEEDDENKPVEVPPNAKAYFTKRDGHDDIIVDGAINGRRVQFCFDTGAHGTFLGKNHLQEIGVKKPEGDATGISGGIGGLVGTWTLKAKVTVGGITRTMPITVSDEFSMNPLLGQDFFRDIEYEIDNRGHCIYFRKSRDLSGDDEADKYAIPFRRSGRHIVVDVEGPGGKKTGMIVDTGAEGIVFTSSNLSELGLKVPDDAERELHMGVGGSRTGYGFYVDSLRLGPIVMRNQKVSYMSAGFKQGLLGQAFFGSWRFTIDNRNQRLRFFH